MGTGEESKGGRLLGCETDIPIGGWDDPLGSQSAAGAVPWLFGKAARSTFGVEMYLGSHPSAWPLGDGVYGLQANVDGQQTRKLDDESPPYQAIISGTISRVDRILEVDEVEWQGTREHGVSQTSPPPKRLCRIVGGSTEPRLLSSEELPNRFWPCALSI